MEDTDQARSTKESEAAVLRDLAWLGITYDEGEPAAYQIHPEMRHEGHISYFQAISACHMLKLVYSRVMPCYAHVFTSVAWQIHRA